MKAKVVTKNGQMSPNGRERRFELRSGTRGTGRKIAAVTFWPWSPKSVEAAEEYIFAAAQRAGVEIVG